MSRARSGASMVDAIASSGLSIYDGVEMGSRLWIPSPELEELLNDHLRGLNLGPLPNRTRSKFVKAKVCEALGYPIPKSFKRTRPRFPGQRFDVHSQKSNNVQVYNEEVSPTRRYVLVRVSHEYLITGVKVITGDQLALLDTTGTLTRKYQARLSVGQSLSELIVPEDTDNLRLLLRGARHRDVGDSRPTANPSPAGLLPIREVYKRVRKLLDSQMADPGQDQERIRGGQLHRRVCAALGYREYADDGRFPDVRNQLLEVKLQTSPTIDLGVVCPNSREPLDLPAIAQRTIRHCDVRYAVFCAHTDGRVVTLTHLYLTTGEAFFSRFERFEGNVVNEKRQIHLPKGFFDA